MNEVAHKEDPGRLTVAAANVENRPENVITDIMAYNTYPGWYWAQPSTMKSSVAHWNRLVGSKGICVSEYGAGANIWHHQQDVQSAPKTDGIFHPEEWQAIVHEQNYRGISSSDFVWGSFVWNMFDFASASRNEGDILGLNDKGLVTYDRKVKKMLSTFINRHGPSHRFYISRAKEILPEENPPLISKFILTVITFT